MLHQVLMPDSVLVPGSSMHGGLIDGLGIVLAGELEPRLLRRSEMDNFRNVITHVVGGYYKPKVRFAGAAAITWGSSASVAS
jgi:hypothetical protein